MDTYKVYKHPIIGYEAIKQGFSWPAFFFTWIWAFLKKLWVAGAILLVAVFISHSISFELTVNGSTAGSVSGLLISIIPMIVSGLKGNEWREKSMLARGFQMKTLVAAESSEGALAEATKAEQDRNRIDNLSEAKTSKSTVEKIFIRILVYSVLALVIFYIAAMIVKFSR